MDPSRRKRRQTLFVSVALCSRYQGCQDACETTGQLIISW